MRKFVSKIVKVFIIILFIYVLSPKLLFIILLTL